MENKILREFGLALISLLSLIESITGLGALQKTWSYEIKEVVSTTSDPERFKFDLQIERVSRGVFAISGNVLINIDIVEGDSNHIQAHSYRSAQSNNDFKTLPFQMPKMHFFKFLNTYYKDTIMKTLKECSDMPIFNKKFEPPLEKKSYKLQACQFSQDGFPNHLEQGFYKVAIVGSGEVDYQLDIIIEVTNDF